jgi:hypothetical protein
MKTRIREFDGKFIPQVKTGNWFNHKWAGIEKSGMYYTTWNLPNTIVMCCTYPTREEAQKTLDNYLTMQELTK